MMSLPYITTTYDDHAFAEFDFILTDLSMPEGDHILQAVMNLMLK